MAVDVLQAGVYTPQQAAAYLREKPSLVRRWAFGYTRRRDGDTTEYPPLIQTELPEIEGRRAITFLELVELLYIRGFRRAGASWPLIDRAAKTAAAIFRTAHPFAMKRFFADPEGIFALLEETDGSESLVELVGHGQHALRDLVVPYLGQLDFDPRDVAMRWWPMGREGRIVLDPLIARGAPTLEDVGIPVRAIVDSYDAEQGESADTALERVAWMYRIPQRQVQDALGFRVWLQAA